MIPVPAPDRAHASSLLDATAFAGSPHAGPVVLVFRTTVADQARVEDLRPELDALVGRSGRWSFDLEDRDRVLRIETDAACKDNVIQLLVERGELCVELE